MPYRAVIHANDKEKVERTITQRIEEKDTDPFLIEYRIIDAKGERRWCSEKGRVLFNNTGDPLFLDGTIFDITQRKTTEEKLRLANEKLKRLVSIDWLTQISNRRHFVDRLEIEWNRSNREKVVLSMILCDIDYFKQFNDNYGHQEGDKCLYSVAQTIKSAVSRPADLVSRFGGEEFIIILPNTDIKGAVYVAERIRSKILELKIPHDYSKAAQYISLSLGVSACIPKPDTLPETLIKATDKALYQAKKQGRNRVIANNFI
jgi:diguanylate cyclase (GGDEF)-like protein